MKYLVLTQFESGSPVAIATHHIVAIKMRTDVKGCTIATNSDFGLILVQEDFVEILGMLGKPA